MTTEEYIEILARETATLLEQEWTENSQLFVLTLRTMTEDAARWVDSGWQTPQGDTIPNERVVVVLTQDLMVLLGHAMQSELKHPALDALVRGAQDAEQAGIIVDPSHRTFFTENFQPS